MDLKTPNEDQEGYVDRKPEKKRPIKPSPAPDNRYQLNLYTPNGLLRQHIPRAVFADMSRKYSDIMRAVPMNKWSTISEIVIDYGKMAKRLGFDKQWRRSPDQIESAVKEMVSAGLVKQK